MSNPSTTYPDHPGELATDVVRFSEVQTCSQLAAYLPFMPLPASWRGHRVEVRLILTPNERAPACEPGELPF